MLPEPSADESPAAGQPAGPRDRFVGDAAGAAAVEIRPAATVMLVRPATGGADEAGGAAEPAAGETGSDGAGAPLEVCLLRRNLQSQFVGGVHVFPGGAVDAADGDPAVLGRCDGLSAARAEAAGGAAFWVAAIRESFEEAGLLAARHEGTGLPLTFAGDLAAAAAGEASTGEAAGVDAAARAARLAAHRRAVDAGERPLGEVLEAEGLRLDLSGMHFVSRWVTPLGLVRRYDTRFFLAAAPAGQALAHDGREAIAAEWHRPAEALRRHAAGQLTMRIPTVMSLRWLAGFATADEALAAAAAITDPPVIEGPPRTPRPAA